MKTGSLIINWVSLFYKRTVTANKKLNQWGFKLFSQSRKIWKCNIGLLCSKNLFMDSNIQKSQNLFVNWKDLESTSLRPTLRKFQF